MIKYFSKIFLRLQGWKFQSKIPNEIKSFVMIGAPHTSNFDFFPAMYVSSKINSKTGFIIKNDWLKIPILGKVLKYVGAIGIDREKISDLGPSNTTDQFVGLFKKYSDFVLMISPEGTRKANPHWKTGFYYIAMKANVPIVFGFADYKNKITGLGGYLYPTNFEDDIKIISKFYNSIQGKHPSQFSEYKSKKKGD